MLYKYIEKISPSKTESFQIKILIFFIFLLKTYSEYSLEPPRRGSSNEYPQSRKIEKKKKKKKQLRKHAYSNILKTFHHQKMKVFR